jgi:hypothetical protein
LWHRGREPLGRVRGRSAEAVRQDAGVSPQYPARTRCRGSTAAGTARWR